MFITYLIDRLQHLGVYYKSEQEFVEHLLSGEVKVSVPDMLQLMQDYKPEKSMGGIPEKLHHLYPSRYEIGERVKVCILPEGEESFPGFPAKITGVHFFTGKVKYDLEVRFHGDFVSRIYNVDSILVIDYEIPRPVEISS